MLCDRRRGRPAVGRATTNRATSTSRCSRASAERVRSYDPISSRYAARIPAARTFAFEHRVLLVETAAGIPLDISLAALPYEARVIERATPFELEGDVRLMTCSAEDLVVLKVLAGRAQDWLDVEGIIVRQGVILDRTQVLDELGLLLELKDDDETGSRLSALFRKHAT